MSTRRGILAALEEAHDFISGEHLAERLGISRAAVWKHIAALKHGGYEIDGIRSRGYRLIAPPSMLSQAAIHSRTEGLRIGKSILVLEVTRSTNSDAMALGREGAPEGNVVIAEEQTAGRGRLGRTWESSRGVNLYMSILLRPQVPPWRAPQLSLVAGVAVAETVSEEGIDARIKWPNDVVTMAGGVAAAGTAVRPPLRKLAGILTEIEAEADCARFVVVGIGVNLNSDASHFSPELEGKATSVLLERGARTDRAAFAARLLSRFEECYDAWTRGGFPAIAPRWRALSVLDGRTVDIASPGEHATGICAGIDDDGALLVDIDGGTRRRVLAGDVTISGGYN
ncbi:MAG TPA: biotin--[acetyl-CoA-carboxylase] ligase [Candidatus Limnocylindrales bacterium]|nr:biotin--[acetyl-CoA-carboxylase] ligase [Candidatus Limnocylindrales bacterium]